MDEPYADRNDSISSGFHHLPSDGLGQQRKDKCSEECH